MLVAAIRPGFPERIAYGLYAAAAGIPFVVVDCSLSSHTSGSVGLQE
ncbi:MAG: hypothetical protein ABIP17_11705 [Ilumatobacteraceae bacterium]